MASLVYTSFLADVFNGNVNTTHSFKAILTTGDHIINRLHAKRSQITNELPTGNGYTQGGAAISVSVSTNTSTHKTTLTVGAVSWPSSSLVARQLHVFRSRGGAASADELVCVIENTSNGVPADLVSSNSTMAWNAPTPATWEIPLPPPV